MSFRAVICARSLINASRSANVLRSLTVRSHVGAGIIAANAYRGPQIRLFQSSVVRAYAAPQEESIDTELSNKLADELKLEGSMDEGMEIPLTVQEYLEKGPFKVNDVPGSDEVVLTRTYGSENITVTFSISAANFDNDMEDDYNWDEEDEGPEDGSGGLMNEEVDLPTIDSKSGRVMSKPRKSGSPFMWLLGNKMSGYGGGSTPNNTPGKKLTRRRDPYAKKGEEEEYPEQEELDEELEGEEEWDDEQSGSRYAPINTKISISKGPDAGTLTVHATATESIFVIDNVSFDTAPVEVQTAQTEFESRSKYSGPPWQQLDEDLQLLMERYLEERGINTALALFIPDYAELKEQKEYISWLKNLKAFVDK